MTPIAPHDIYHLGTKRLGKQVWFFQCLDSTNSLALSLAGDFAKDGLALLAEEQTSGRGQYGRTWEAPPGSSVLLSVLFFPPVGLRAPALLTAWAAVSVCETIEEVAGLQAAIKWPNDVLIRGRKVCGILIEQRSGSGDLPPATVVGIGLNVRQAASFFAQADLPGAASLASLSGATFDTRFVAERLIGQLDASYDRLLQGDTGTLEALWQGRLGLVGQQVVVATFEQTKEGRLLEIAWDGVLLEESGQIFQIPTETVRRLDRLVGSSPLGVADSPVI
jgi:BirA family biotin operon repressor/biotin-[acetyl-CoA-carboxylase] ligase